MLDVTIASLDDLTPFARQKAIWLEDKLPWGCDRQIARSFQKTQAIKVRFGEGAETNTRGRVCSPIGRMRLRSATDGYNYPCSFVSIRG
jgi:hypothetical protein